MGDYQIIFSYITAREKYNYEHFTVFLLSKNGEKLGDDPKAVTDTQSDPAFDPVTKKHYHKCLVYDYSDGIQHYRITYQAENIIEYFTLAQVDEKPEAKASAVLLWLVKLARLGPSYIRMTGTVTLERFDGERVPETVTSPGIWEQMYFGLDEDV